MVDRRLDTVVIDFRAQPLAFRIGDAIAVPHRANRGHVDKRLPSRRPVSRSVKSDGGASDGGYESRSVLGVGNFGCQPVSSSPQ